MRTPGPPEETDPGPEGPADSEWTELLLSWSRGDRRAIDRLMPRLYPRLRHIARRLMHGERATHSLEVTGLVHETFAERRPRRLAALEEALRDLARIDRQRAAIVELRFFFGLERQQISELLGISSATVTRRWRSARAWLLHQLSARPDGG